jgi:hypothetical protein
LAAHRFSAVGSERFQLARFLFGDPRGVGDVSLGEAVVTGFERLHRGPEVGPLAA